ncbi:hypothetical protein STEG23_017945 [Scotinomys teguina]
MAPDKLLPFCTITEDVLSPSISNIQPRFHPLCKMLRPKEPDKSIILTLFNCPSGEEERCTLAEFGVTVMLGGGGKKDTVMDVPSSAVRKLMSLGPEEETSAGVVGEGKEERIPVKPPGTPVTIPPWISLGFSSTQVFEGSGFLLIHKQQHPVPLTTGDKPESGFTELHEDDHKAISVYKPHLLPTS